jgi:hypothetical protein
MSIIRTPTGRAVRVTSAVPYGLNGRVLVCETHKMAVHHKGELDEGKVLRTWEWCPRCGGPPSRQLTYLKSEEPASPVNDGDNHSVTVLVEDVPIESYEASGISEELPKGWTGPKTMDCGHLNFWLRKSGLCSECVRADRISKIPDNPTISVEPVTKSGYDE